ncbi:MAG: diphosphomevalonate decarboxylase [Pseudomonadales bacterium]
MARTAIAHPNIALVKYWGKAEGPGNVPATPSLSITLDGFRSRTTVDSLPAGASDQIYLNDKAVEDAKINAWLTDLRTQHSVPALTIRSDNNFPTASGLASSASGFAALVCAINAECALGLDRTQLSIWARRASASAARSLCEGFATLCAPQWAAEPLRDCDDWPLKVVVAITSKGPKGVSSSIGMAASKQTAPYFDSWTQTTAADFERAQAAVAAKDFAALASVAEQSCLRMHALMLATTPPLIYWQPATLACIAEVQRLQSVNVPVFFTIDAGPQVKAVCLPEAAEQVAAALGVVAGVLDTHILGLGRGARLEQ